MTELPTGTVTFLFTDIEGSTRLVRELGQQYGDVLAEHQRIVRRCVDEHHGREIDTQGDSFLVAFSRAGTLSSARSRPSERSRSTRGPTALGCASEWGCGEPRPTGERYVGLGVHRAARIGSIGHGGQVLLSNATRELLEDDLPPGRAFRDLGLYRLKDFDRPERIVQLVGDGLDEEFRPLKAERLAEQRPLWRRPTAIVLAVTVVTLAGVAAFTALARNGGGSVAVVPNSVLQIDAETNEILGSVPVGRNPGDIVAVGKYVFVSSQDDATLSRIDVDSEEVTTSGASAADLGLAAVGDTSLWVASVREARVTRVRAESLAEIERIPLARNLAIATLASSEGSLWISQFSPPPVLRYRTRPTKLQRRYEFGPSEIPVEVTTGFGAAWVGRGTSNSLLRIDLRSGVQTAIPLGQFPSDPTAGLGAVWVAMPAADTLWRVNPFTEKPDSIVQVGDLPFGVATGAGSVWVSNNCEGSVSRIDPSTNQVIATIRTGFFPVWLTVAHGRVWVGLADKAFDPPACD